jgi:alkyl-hydroperoxide reductase/thiol specific antioxidant family protein
VVQLHRAGIENLVVVGSGAPMFIEGFRETTGFTGPIYTDPSLEVYKAAQLKRGMGTMLKLGAAAATVGSLRRGFRQGRTQGDATQQGGVLVIARDGRILYHHISGYPGDNAAADAIQSAVAAG